MSHVQTLLLNPPKIEYDFDTEKKKSFSRQSVEQNGTSVWSEGVWNTLDAQVRRKALLCNSEDAMVEVIVRAARKVLRTYSSSFFIVTRFLPLQKRKAVELIYAAVRYPDEIVDTFPLTAHERSSKLHDWRNAFIQARTLSVRQALEKGLPVFAAGFAEVSRQYGIPAKFYHSFLDAMQADAQPRMYSTMDDLIDSYVYGSAVVVGYFLCHVYGTLKLSAFDRALQSSRNLGIALQLTNFLRDVNEDRRRGRLYIPTQMLYQEGMTLYDLDAKTNRNAHLRVLRRFAEEAESYYEKAEHDLDAFSPDCLPAIRACIGVYRSLNSHILSSPNAIDRRISLSWHKKFQHLPSTKYWKIPLEYIRSAV